jgi:hypothetical protein
MIIANPIYDVVFKYLMDDAEIAKGIISRIIGEQLRVGTELEDQLYEETLAAVNHE